MLIRPDVEYYNRREHQERALADRATNEAGRRVHLEMARRYAELIVQARQNDVQPAIRISAWG